MHINVPRAVANSVLVSAMKIVCVGKLKITSFNPLQRLQRVCLQYICIQTATVKLKTQNVGKMNDNEVITYKLKL